MKQYNSNLVFVDLLFNLLVGFTSLFVIAFMLINPIAKNATIDPPVVFIIECTWDKYSKTDIDLYVRGPDDNVVYFANKDGAYMILERDDLGYGNDTYIINDEPVVIERNYEMITMSQMPPGEYVVNAHYYSVKGLPETVTVSATKVAPFFEVIERTVELVPRQEITIVSFVVEENGSITDIRTDIQTKIRETRGPN